MTDIALPYRIGIQQRVLPAYRAPFFDALAGSCPKGLAVFGGQPLPGEAIETADRLREARLFLANNRHLLRGRFYLCWQGGLTAWLEDWQPDVLIVEANPRYPSTPRAVAWMRGRGRAVIGWGLGAPGAQGLRGAYWRRFLRSFDALVTYSRRGAEEYRTAGFDAERIFVAPNAVTSRPISPPPERPVETGRQPAVLFVGRLQARKRIDNLLRACAALPLEAQPRLCIVGDGPARAEFENLARQIYPRAEFPGALHGDDLEPYFAAADLFVLPGTGGLAVQQAMAHALPVIAAEADGTQDDLVRPENGWRVPPDDLEALTAVLRQALSDAARLRQMGAQSYRLVTEEANLEIMLAAFAQAISAAVNWRAKMK